MEHSRRDRWRGRAWTALGSLPLVGGIALAFTLGDQVTAFRHELAALGAAGVLLYILLEIVWCLTTVPSAPMMTLAGLAFGPWLGMLAATVGHVLGTSAAFWVGRTVARERILKLVRRYDLLQTVSQQVEEHQVLSVALVRLVPMFPINLLNYAFGVTSMRFRIYLVVSFALLVPGAGFYTGLGNALALKAGGEELPNETLLWLGGFGILVVVLGWYVKARSRELHRSSSDADRSGRS